MLLYILSNLFLSLFVDQKYRNNMASSASQHSLSSQILSEGKFSAIFPGWGASRVLGLQALPKSRVVVIGDTATPDNFTRKELVGRDANEKLYKRRKIGTLFSLSIAGCDLMGSCLYTAGVCTVNSGKVTTPNNAM